MHPIIDNKLKQDTEKTLADKYFYCKHIFQ
jgi:hypothetical protein